MLNHLYYFHFWSSICSLIFWRPRSTPGDSSQIKINEAAPMLLFFFLFLFAIKKIRNPNSYENSAFLAISCLILKNNFFPEKPYNFLKCFYHFFFFQKPYPPIWNRKHKVKNTKENAMGMFLHLILIQCQLKHYNLTVQHFLPM